MPRLHTTVVPTLGWVRDETLDRLTADAHTFASTPWYRLLDRLPLSSLTGGEAELTYVVALADEVPVGICPVLRAAGKGTYFVYSLRRFFFEHWLEEAVRLAPDGRRRWERISPLVSAYRSFLQWAGSSLEECLIATSPLSYRAHLPVAPCCPIPSSEIRRALVTEVLRYARRRRLPLWFLGVEGDEGPLNQTLGACGLHPAFLFFDNRIDLDHIATFDDYLSLFRRTTRRAFLRDVRRTADAGVEFQHTSNFSAHADELAEMYNQVYSKYGESYFRHPPAFWTILEQELGPSAEALFAHYRGRLIAFCVLLKDDRRREMWTYRMGRYAVPELADVPYCFGLNYYEPIKRALELGYTRLWLGPASYEAKSIRGARQIPLYSYFWFPRRTERWFLLPYVRLFGRISAQEIAASLQRPIRLERVLPVELPAAT